MIGYRPLPLFKWCWMFITPVMIIILLVMLIIDFKPLSYKNTRQNYQYPMWFESIGYVTPHLGLPGFRVEIRNLVILGILGIFEIWDCIIFFNHVQM